MTDEDRLLTLLGEERGKVAARWREHHLAVIPLPGDRDVVDRAHGRNESCLAALHRAFSASDPDDWGTFAHREVVQVMTMMAHALARDATTALAAGALVPSLTSALESCGAARVAERLLPLAVVAAEGASAAQLSVFSGQEQLRLKEGTPLLSLPGDVLLLAVTGRPSQETAGALVDRATTAALGLTRPALVLDLSHAESLSAQALSTLLALDEDIRRLDGRCFVVGLRPEMREAAEGAGVDLSRLELRLRLDDAVFESMGWGRFLVRLSRALK